MISEVPSGEWPRLFSSRAMHSAAATALKPTDSSSRPAPAKIACNFAVRLRGMVHINTSRPPSDEVPGCGRKSSSNWSRGVADLVAACMCTSAGSSSSGTPGTVSRRTTTLSRGSDNSTLRADTPCSASCCFSQRVASSRSLSRSRCSGQLSTKAFRTVIPWRDAEASRPLSWWASQSKARYSGIVGFGFPQTDTLCAEHRTSQVTSYGTTTAAGATGRAKNPGPNRSGL